VRCNVVAKLFVAMMVPNQGIDQLFYMYRVFELKVFNN
jgi:hypothetical protein